MHWEPWFPSNLYANGFFDRFTQQPIGFEILRALAKYEEQRRDFFILRWCKYLLYSQRRWCWRRASGRLTHLIGRWNDITDAYWWRRRSGSFWSSDTQTPPSSKWMNSKGVFFLFSSKPWLEKGTVCKKYSSSDKNTTANHVYCEGDVAVEQDTPPRAGYIRSYWRDFNWMDTRLGRYESSKNCRFSRNRWTMKSKSQREYDFRRIVSYGSELYSA